jgi:hypothetical protein
MRAAYRYPLQFTDISTVTGVASASATIGNVTPFQVAGPKVAETMTLSPGITVSGGPQFNVANLNNQEFYQGIQAPLEPQIMANYINAGIPIKVLLPIFVSDIEVDDAKTGKKYNIHNTAVNQASYANFLTAVNGLAKQGLALEPASSSEPVGPVLSADQAADPRLLAGLVQAAATGGTLLSLNGIRQGNEVSRSKFQLTKSGSRWHFCFKTPTTQPYKEDAFTISDPKSMTHSRVGKLQYANSTFTVNFTIDQNDICGNAKKGDGRSGQQEVTSNLKFTMRSVEGVFLYLGEMARTELALDGNNQGDLDDPNGGPVRSFATNDPRSGPRSLFKVWRNLNGASLISAEFMGEVYSVLTDPTGADASSQVIQILTDLLALKSSAKSLPAPNVISVVQ